MAGNVEIEKQICWREWHVNEFQLAVPMAEANNEYNRKFSGMDKGGMLGLGIRASLEVEGDDNWVNRQWWPNKNSLFATKNNFTTTQD